MQVCQLTKVPLGCVAPILCDRDPNLVRINQDPVTRRERIRSAAFQAVSRRVETDAVPASVLDVIHRVAVTDHGMMAGHLGMREHPGIVVLAADAAALFVEGVATGAAEVVGEAAERVSNEKLIGGASPTVVGAV